MDHRDTIKKLTEIGYSLSAEKDIDSLMNKILTKARQMLACDAGTIYIRREADRGPGVLEFSDVQNDSIRVELQRMTIPIEKGTIPGYCALSGTTINVKDAYFLDAVLPYAFDKRFDDTTGYRTRSILSIPMKDRDGNVLGVITLYNRKSDPGRRLKEPSDYDDFVVTFGQDEVELAESIASQAAISLDNARLYQDIKNLFEGFVAASVKAVESRDPPTAGHSERVADMSVELARKVDAIDSGPFKRVGFSREDLQELQYASVLHDFGKVSVSENILLKGNKLYAYEMELLKSRFDYLKMTARYRSSQTRIKYLLEQSRDEYLSAVGDFDRELGDQIAELDDYLAFIAKIDNPQIMRTDIDGLERLQKIGARTYIDEEGREQPYLKPFELSNLSTLKGSLNEEERLEVQSHVTHTYDFLNAIPWTKSFGNLAEIAYGHHEKLNGSGYPRGLTSSEIPLQSKMMTISDIFDALTSFDRPYKNAVTTERALEILEFERKDGCIDSKLLEIFLEAKIYRVAEYKRLKHKVNAANKRRL